MSIVKKLAAGAVTLVGSLPVLAQESGSGNFQVDTTKAGEAVDAIGTAVSGLISGKVAENVLLVLGAGLFICMLFLGVRWILRGGKTAAK